MLIALQRFRPAWRPARSLALGALSGALLVSVEALGPQVLRPTLAQTSANCPLPDNIAITFLEA